jgi:RNA-binding protein 5/10
MPRVCLSVTNFRKGKRRAFIQFEDVDHAAAFVNENFPKVRITLPQTTDDVPDGKISAYIHFAHRRDDTEARVSGGGQWVCQPVRSSMLH